MFHHRSISSSGVRLNLLQGPDNGPPLLFLHGVLRRAEDFTTLLAAFSSRWQVHALDFRGHGRSDPGTGHRVSHYLEDAVAAIDRVLPGKVAVYGHSLGALVALGAAGQRPERVGAIVLEDPPSPSFMAGLKETTYQAQFVAFQALLREKPAIPELARRMRDVVLPGPNGTTLRLGQLRDAASLRFSAWCLHHLAPPVLDALLQGGWLDGYDWHAALKAVRCPALLLRGRMDRGGMLPEPDAETMAEHLQDCTLVDCEAGHLLHWDLPEVVARVTAQFLETVRPNLSRSP